jgi:hypothetical protein
MCDESTQAEGVNWTKQIENNTKKAGREMNE